ncbi:MAG: RND transporter [Hydrogenophilales bacterium CG17_big_fil_post_rev_8_21_14_2_50_63_12]|nr:MAG: RND transporter [Hydrogenophilales bacterium CG17_big_fil_post_rev_8_21_14_2_50_63_12]
MALLLGLSGCAAVGPDYQAPALPLPAAWSSGIASQPAEDIAEWWKRLQDPTLDQLIAQALAASPDLKVAQARLREARARRELADGARLPSVSISAAASRAKSSKNTGSGATRDLYNAGFDASWEPDVFGATRRGSEAAQADLQASAASLDNTRVSLVAEVARNYVELRGTQARLGIARANLASQSETLQLVAWRAQAGLGSSLEVEQARTNREQTRAQIPTLETSLAQAEHQIALLLGEAPASLHAPLAPVAAIPQVADALAVGIPADTLRRRPDLRAAERKLAAETARIGVAEAARYPSFQLSGSIGLDALSVGGLFGSAELGHSLLASVAVTLFDGGRLRSRVDIQNAVQEQARVNYQNTLLTALREVEDALVALANSRQRQDALGSAATAARNAALLARQRYSSGLIDFLTVLDSERSQRSVEDSLATADTARATALIQLYKALGGGWVAPPETTDANARFLPALQRNPS